MKKYLIILLLPLLAFTISCEDEAEADTTPPTIETTSYSSGQTVGGLVNIVATVSDDDSIKYVEFFIDGSSVKVDDEYPYEYEWSTESYEECTSYDIKVTATDMSDNVSEQIISLTVNQIPETPVMREITYDDYWGKFLINWFHISASCDFQSYIVYESSYPDMRDSIKLGFSVFGYYSFDRPTEIKYYYVRSSDNVQNKSEPSEVVELKPYVEILGYNYLIDTVTVIDPSWQGLNVPSNATFPNDITKLRQLEHIRLGGINLSGEIPSELWNLPDLYEIDLSNNQLTGQFPTNLTLTDPSSIRSIVLNNNQLSGNIDFIGNFTNLIMLRLYNNEFSGVIPEAICTNWAGGSTYISEWFELGNNNLCPPYPSCFYSSSSQNTADCN